MTDVDDVQEPGFERYTAALRRLWWVGLAGVLLGALAVTVGGSRSSDVSASAQVLVVDNASSLAAILLPSDTVSKAVPLRSELTSERITALNTQVNAKVPRPVKLSATLADPQMFTLRVRGRGVADVAAGLDAAVDLFGRRWAEVTTAAAAPAADALKAQHDTFEARLGALDQELAGLTKDQTSLADAYRAERLRALTDLAEIDMKQSSVTQYVRAATSSVRVASRTAPSRTSSSTGFVVGAVGGGLVAAALILLLTLFDRSVRSRRDVERVCSVPVLGLLSASADHSESVAAVAALAASARGRSVTTVGLLPDRTRSTDAGLLQSIVDLAGDDGELTVASLAGFRESPDAAFDSEKSALVLVATWGRTDERDLASVCRALAVADRAPAGVLLVGVPRRQVRSAST